MLKVLSQPLRWLQRLAHKRLRRSSAPEISPLPIDLADPEPLDLFNPYPEPVQLEIGEVMDLHAIAPRDVPLVVKTYLHEARQRGFRRVRIVHGKGKGVQRAVVHRILAETSFVESWTDAPPEAGGWGATIVRMRDERSPKSEVENPRS